MKKVWTALHFGKYMPDKSFLNVSPVSLVQKLRASGTQNSLPKTLTFVSRTADAPYCSSLKTAVEERFSLPDESPTLLPPSIVKRPGTYTG